MNLGGMPFKWDEQRPDNPFPQNCRGVFKQLMANHFTKHFLYKFGKVL